MSETTSKMPLWLDVDTGHDDAYALLLAAYDPRVHLLGVSTVHGNASLKNTTYNTQSILEAIGRRDVPVYPGAAKPIYRDAVHAEAIHGESGLGGVTLLPEPITPAIHDTDVYEVMYNALMTAPVGTAGLVSTGTLTNIALLFEKYPDLAEHIKALSIMGGAIGGSFTDAPMGQVAGEGERFGNITPYAEFNCDPEAAQSIFSNPILAPKTTLITLDLTHKVLATETVQSRLLYGEDAPTTTYAGEKAASIPKTIRALFHEVITFFAQTYADEFAITEGPPLHDPLAVLAAFSPEYFSDNSRERFSISVVTTGQHDTDIKKVGQLGRTVIEKLKPGEAGIRIPRGSKVNEFWDLIEAALQKAEKVSPLPPLDQAKRNVVRN